MTRARRWAVVVVALLLSGVGPAGAGAATARADETDARPTLEVLNEAAASLEQEAALLGRLWGMWQGWGREGAERAARYLADSQVRVWQGWVEAGDAFALGLVGSLPPGWREGGELPSADAAGLEAGAAPLAGGWVALQAARERVLQQQQAVEAWIRAEEPGLPRPGRTCPVQGAVEFSRTWGEERPWGRVHQGEDLHADPGTAVVAVESGTVLQAGWHWQGGFGVWLEGRYSGGVYYYAHLAWFAPGVRPGATVGAGDLLGWVGATGNATSPHLHFAWLPGGPADWAALGGFADPYLLLVGLCR